jgi:DNA-binding SARP family transcriptional activator
MTLRLITLGRATASLDGRELPGLPGKPVTFALLVFLAVERQATRDRVVGVFWPESSQENARHALSQTLYELRQTLGESWIGATGATLRVEDSVAVDCLEFLRLAEEGRNAEAVALYSGPFLDGLYLAQTHAFQEWVARERARLGRRFRAAVDGLLTECRQEGNLDTALGVAWKWVGMDPLDEGGQQHLIRLLAETGTRTQALAQYERYVAQLETELGLEPLDETVELVEAIRAGDVRSPARGNRPGELSAPEPSGPSWPTGWPSASRPGANHGVGRPSDPTQDREEMQRLIEEEMSPSLQVVRPIGRGSMAHVFLAREPHLRRLVAVKVLSPHLCSDPRTRKRFEREAQAAARINSPHVCTVHRVGSLSNGTPYLVSQFVKGTSLAQRLQAEGRLPPSEVHQVVIQIASALAAAHKLGILHRDVRPDNVMRADETGWCFLCDFGLAGVLETGDDPAPRLTRTGEILGDPTYISPEQMNGDALTDRADVFSLGILAYQLLTGHPPTLMGDEPSLLEGGRSAVDVAPLTDYLVGTDAQLAEVLRQCLARDPAHRPTAADLVRRLSSTSPGSMTRGGDSPGEEHQEPVGRLVFRKRLIQILGGFIAAAWIGVEALDHLANKGLVPTWLYWIALVTVPFGFVSVSIVGWFHGEKGRQAMPAVEKWMLAVLAVGWGAAVAWLLQVI